VQSQAQVEVIGSIGKVHNMTHRLILCSSQIRKAVNGEPLHIPIGKSEFDQLR